MAGPSITGVKRLLGVLAIALAVVGAPAPVAAECDGPQPSFRAAVLTATTIVIGDVTDVSSGGGWGSSDPGTEGSSRFLLRIRHVLRGSVPDVMEMVDVPTQPCAPGIVARPGDRIAVALDATAYTPPMSVNAVAWIRGRSIYEDGQRISTAGVFELLGLAPPDTSTVPQRPPSASAAWPLPMVLLVGVLGCVVAVARLHHRDPALG